jgi:hypothetical protein
VTIEIGLFEAKTHLSELVDRVASHGEEVRITRRGTPVARLVPIANTESPIENALALLLAARQGSSSGTGSLRELIDDGRHA